MIDYYAILGVPRNATPIEIRDAYLKLARDTHPDKVIGAEARKRAEDVFKNVTAAYDTLSKERSRRDYTSRLPATKEPSGERVVSSVTTMTTTATTTPKAAPPIVKGPPLPPREPAAAPVPSSPTPPSGTSGPIRSGPVNFDALTQGIDAFKKQDYHSAVQLLNMAVNQNDKSAVAHAMLSLSLAKNPNWVRDAVQHMEAASKLDPKNVSYLVELALLFHSQGLKLRAKRALDGAIALAPNHPDVARGVAEIQPDADAPAKPAPEPPSGILDRLRKR